jgi:hypothetical protein
MAPLSPAAQAVLDAFLDTAVDAGNYYATRSCQIAAALRAAAGPVPGEPSVSGNYAAGFHYGIVFGCQFLHDIAAELEQAAPNNTTETTP